MESKKGSVLLCAGLISSFVLFGILFSGVISFFDFEKDSIKFFAALFLIIISLFFIFPFLSNKLSEKSSKIANLANKALDSIKTKGLLGQFIIGLFLGAIWTPCSDPTIGFALSLIAMKQEIFYGAMIMLVFGIASVIPLIFIAYISRSAINIDKIHSLYSKTKLTMGVLIFSYSLIINRFRRKV